MQLDSLYIQVLKGSLMKNRSSADTTRLTDRFRKVVGVIVALFDILSIPALASLMLMSVEELEISLRILHSVINVLSEPRSPIRLLHPSFRDFLFDETRCRDRRFYINQGRVYAELAADCLKVLSRSLTRNVCNLDTAGSSAQELQKASVGEKLPIYVQYACQYWVAHLELSNSARRVEVGMHDNGKVHTFFKESFLYWLEAMSLIGKMSEGVLMIRTLVSMREVCYDITLLSCRQY